MTASSPQHYVLVRMVDGQGQTTEMAGRAEFTQWMNSEGYALDGSPRDTAHLHEALRDQPRFEGVIGPMLDETESGAEAIRYECPEAYKMLSS